MSGSDGPRGGPTSDDPVMARFYDRHPYPPPPPDLDRDVRAWRDGLRRRAEHARFFPASPYRDDLRVLVAGCGTRQAATYAVRHPDAHVVGIDVSRVGLEHNARLASRYGLTRVRLERLAVEDVARLGQQFDLVVCTGVLHHLRDPAAGLRALREVLAPGGAAHVMVYATYGRVGLTMLQQYVREVGVGSGPAELDGLVGALRHLPARHPLAPLLQEVLDFADPDAVADALLNPRERTYSVPDLLDLVDASGLTFARWLRQAPYLPRCGAVAASPHAERLQALEPRRQYAAMELFRGSITRHSAVLVRDDAPDPQPVDLARPGWQEWVPVRPPSVVLLDRDAGRASLPGWAAAVLLDRGHVDPDLVVLLTAQEARFVAAVDGRRRLAELPEASAGLVRRLWEHDHLLLDTSR